MKRCLSGCLKSLKDTSKVVTKMEDLRGVQGFSNAMIQRIEDRFKEGPLFCECTKMFKNLEDLTIHIKSFHHKKKKHCKNPKKLVQSKEVNISELKLPEEGGAAYAVIMALNGRDKKLTKTELQQEAKKFTSENLTMKGNKLSAFKTTWHKINNLVMAEVLQKSGTPVLYSLTAKGLAIADSSSCTDNRANIRKIPQVHRLHFDEGKVIRRILGDGTCLYGCASLFVHETEDREKTATIRRLAHKFLKDTWRELGHDEDHVNLFPHDFTIAGQVEKVTLASVSDWLQFLQTDQSLYLYTEFEVETQSLANLMNSTIKILNYNKDVAYMNTYDPQPEIANRSPMYNLFESSRRTMVVYHEIDSHFELIVDKR